MRALVLIGCAALALSACATATDDRPFDSASCYEREFNVYFDGLSTDVSPEAREVIDAMGNNLRGCYIESVRVVGAADAQASAVTNEAVSERRAVAIADYLARRLGWPRDRMAMAALGERGAVTDEGLAVPMRHRARVTVVARAP